MKIGIYTITEGENYGNRLQNYALQKTLEKRGYDVRTILDKKYKYNTFFKLKNTIKKITGINDSRFAKRCIYTCDQCHQSCPKLMEVRPGHFVSCHLWKDFLVSEYRRMRNVSGIRAGKKTV